MSELTWIRGTAISQAGLGAPSSRRRFVKRRYWEAKVCPEPGGGTGGGTGKTPQEQSVKKKDPNLKP